MPTTDKISFRGIAFVPENPPASTPSVSSVTRANPSPTNAGSVDYTVTFSESVTGVGTGDFTLDTTGVTGASVSNVSGSGTTYTVTVNTGSGDGTIRLDVIDDDSIVNAGGGKLGGTGSGNGNFTTGQVYTLDRTAPTVSSITRVGTSPTNAASVDYTVTFSESVTGVGTGDFTLDTTGVTGASVSNVSGSGATYTVTVNTGSGDGTIRLDLSDDDSIVDAATNKIGGTGTGNGNFAGQVFTVDKTVPTVTSIVRVGASPTNAASVDYTVTFSEGVTGVGAADFVLTTSGVTGASVTNVTGSGSTYTVTVGTGSGDGTIRLDLTDDDSIRDAAGNTLAGMSNGSFTGEAYTIDKTAPGVVSIVRAGSNPTTAASVDFTVTFNEPVTGVGLADFALTTTGVSGALITNVSGSGTTYTVTVGTGSGDGSIRLDLIDDDSIADPTGNLLGGTGTGNGNFTAGEAYTLDRTAPTVASVVRAGGAGPFTNAGSVQFMVTFSEDVTGVTGPRFTPVGTLAGAAVSGVSGVSGGPRVYTVTVTTGTGEGTLGLDVPASAAIQDAAGNALTVAFAGGEAYTLDRTAPNVAVGAPSLPITNAGPVEFVVTYSDANPFTVGLTAAQVQVLADGTAAAGLVEVLGSGDTRTVRLSNLTGDGTLRIALLAGTATDAAGNAAPTAGPSAAVTVDNTAPTVTGAALLVPDPTNLTTVAYTVTFSEPVLASGPGAFTLTTTGTIAGAGVVNVSQTGALEYLVTLTTGTGDGTIRLDVLAGAGVTDAAGNVLAAPFTNAPVLTVLKTQPDVTITSPVDGTTVGPATYSGAITGTAADALGDPVAAVQVTIERGSDGRYWDGSAWVTTVATSVAATVTGTTWAYAFPAGVQVTGEEYTVRVAAADSAGNGTSSGAQVRYLWDAAGPFATVDVAGGVFSPATWGGSIGGSAFDVGPAGIAEVRVVVTRSSDGMYYDAAAGDWVSDPVVNLGTPGFPGWQLALPAADLDHDVTYTVTATAVDRAGNEQSVPGTGSFTYDAVAPTAAVTVPPGGFAGPDTWPAADQITGTVADAGAAGVAAVELLIERLSDGRYWNGSAFATGLTFLSATVGSEAWSYTLPAAALTDGTGYRVTSTASDTVGNFQATPGGTGTFVWDAAAPTQTIDAVGTGTLVGPTGFTGFSGTAADSGSGVAAVSLTLTRQSDGFAWDGTAFVSGTPTLTAALVGPNWTYPFAAADLADGETYTLTATARDGVSNLGSPTAATFTFDASGPTTTVTAPSGTVTAATWTGHAGIAADAAGVALVEYRVLNAAGDVWDGATFGAGGWFAAAGTTSWTAAFDFADFPASGGYRVEARSTDSVGNIGPVAAVDFTVTLPTLTSIDRLTPPAAVSNTTGPVTWRLTFSDPVAGMTAANFALAGSFAGAASVTAVTPAGGTTWDITATVPAAGTGTLGLNFVSPAGLTPAVETAAFTGPVFTLDRVAPTVTITNDAPAAVVRAGVAVRYTVTFADDTAVGSAVLTAADMANAVTAGGAAFAVTNFAAAGPNAFAFDVTPTSGGAFQLLLTAPAVTDTAGNALAVPVTDATVLTVDGTPPAVVSITPGVTSPTNAAEVSFTVTFSEPVTGVDETDFALVAPDLTGAAITSVSGGGDTYVVVVATGTGDGTLRLDVLADDTITDGPGNPLAGAFTGPVVTVDKTGPTATVDVAPGQAADTNALPIRFAVVFSEPVVGFDAGAVVLSGTAGGLAGATVVVTNPAGDDTTFEVAVSGLTADGVVSVAVAAELVTDRAGNAFVPATASGPVSFDTTAPAVVSVVADGPSPTNADGVLYTVTFSEDVTGVDAADFVFTTVGVSGAAVFDVSGGGAVYTVLVFGVTGDGTLRLDLSDDDSIADLAGNPLGGPGAQNGDYTTGDEYQIDQTAPTATVVAPTPDLRNTPVSSVTITFDEPVFGLDVSAFTLTRDGAPLDLSAAVLNGGGDTYSLDNLGALTALDGVYVLTLDNTLAFAFDAAGNFVSADASAAFTVDVSAPTVTIVPATTGPTNAATVSFTVTFSEPVLGVDTDPAGGFDFFALAGTAPGASVVSVTAGAPGVYTVVVSTGAGVGTVALQLDANTAIADAAGNAVDGLPATSADVAVDRVAPAVTVADADADGVLAVNVPVVFTVDVLDDSALVGTLTAADFSNAGTAAVTVGTVTSAAIAGGVRFSVPVTPTGAGTVQLRLDTAALADAAGNAPALPIVGRTLAVDAVAPTVVVSLDAGQAALTNAQPVRFAVTFSEPVVGFDDTKVTLAGPGTAGATVQVSGDGQTFVVTVSGLTADGAVALTVAGGVVTDTAGNPSAASTGTDNVVTLDTAPPAVGAPVLDPASDSAALDGVTSVRTPTFTGTAEAGAFVELVVGGTVRGTAVATGGVWTITASSLPDGPLAVFARATDAAGNTARSALRGLTVDTVSPAVTVTRADGQAATVLNTADLQVVFVVTVSQTVAGLDPAALTVTGTAGGTIQSVTGSGGNYQVLVGGFTRPGTVSVAVAAGAGLDLAGNLTLAAPPGETVAVQFATTGTLAVTPDDLRAGDAVTVSAVLTSAAGVAVEGSVVYTLTGPAGTPTQTVAVAGGAAPAVTFPVVAAGDYTVTAAFTGAAGFRDTSFSGTFAVLPSIPTGQNSTDTYAATTGTTVTLYNGDDGVTGTVAPFTRDESPFGVRVAVADVTGDGVPDVVAGTAPGVAAQVRVIDGATGATVYSLPVFEGFTGGTFVAAGDLNGDGKAEFVVTPDQSGGPRVLVFDGATGAQLASFLGIDDANFRGGARVAVGDLNRDGVSDLVVSAGFGGGPRVAGFDGLSVGAGAPRKLFNDFFLFAPDLRDGTYVSVGDVDGDGYGDVIGGAGPGGAPRVLALSGRELVTTGALAPLSNFFAGDTDLRGGVRVTAKDFDGDGRAELVVGSGDTGDVAVYTNAAITGADPRPTDDFDLIPGLLMGVHVG